MMKMIKALLLHPLIPSKVKNAIDYRKNIILFCINALIFFGGLIAAIFIPKDHFIQIWLWWGLFCMFAFLPKVLKSVFRTAKSGYDIGKKATEEEYIEINHVGGNQYRATRRKDDNGMFFAIVAGIFKFMLIGLWYEFLGPILLCYHNCKIIINILEYHKANKITGDEASDI